MQHNYFLIMFNVVCVTHFLLIHLLLIKYNDFYGWKINIIFKSTVMSKMGLWMSWKPFIMNLSFPFSWDIVHSDYANYNIDLK